MDERAWIKKKSQQQKTTLLLILAVNRRHACLTLSHLLSHKKWRTKRGWGGGVFRNTPRLRRFKTLDYTIQSHTALWRAWFPPTGIMKVSSELAQREPKCIFHHRSPFIIHGNRLESGALKVTNVDKHESGGAPRLFNIPGGASLKCLTINRPPRSAVRAYVCTYVNCGNI